MASSDDDSFVWTSCSESTSSDSGDTHTMAERHGTDNSAEESEYDKSYKKKLQKQLFKNEEHNGTIDSEGPKKKSKKRKIKTEVEEAAKRGRPSEEDEDAYLAAHVKRERQRSLSASSAGANNLSHNSDGPSQKKKRNLETSIEIDIQATPTKKNKKKKHVVEIECNESDELTDYTNIEDKFTAEETIVQQRVATHTGGTGTGHYNQNGSSLVQSSSGVETNEESTHINRSAKKKNKKTRASASGDSECAQPEQASTAHPEQTSTVVSSDEITPSNKKSSKRSSKISEMITFEDDNETIESDERSEPSSRLNKFLKTNPNLQQLDIVIEDKDSIITEDDELWLLNFPHNIDITTLQQSSLTIDTKCKTKIGGKKFDGIIEDGEATMTVMCHKNANKPCITNMHFNSTVRFTHRIPKVHIAEDNVMVNNQTNFIPLPDTKCRHPLFGSDYKKAIKLTSATKARLNGINSEEDQSYTEVKRKKKHKKHKEEEVLPKEEDVRVAEKRKHRSSDPDTDQPTPKKKKKKHKQSSEPVAWESEKAIEENLFNF